jgi:hypothetical protein
MATVTRTGKGRELRMAEPPRNATTPAEG